jgi:hypothetical protein
MAAPNPDELKKIKSLLDEISKIYSKLGENNPFAKFDTKNITDADAAVGQLNVGLRDAKKQLDEVTDGAQGLYAALKETVNELSKSNSSVKDSIRSFNKLSSLAQQLRDDQKGISELNMKDLKTMQSKLESEVQNLRVSTDSANLRKQELITKSSTVGLLPHERAEFIKINKTIAANNNLLNDQDSILEDLRNQVEERLELEGKIQRQMGLSGAIVGSFKKLLPGPLAEAMKIDEAVEKMREAAKEGKSKFGVMFTGLKSMGKGLIETLQDPLTSIMLLVKLFKEFLNIGFAADKRIVDLGKSLAISKEEARDLNTRFGEITRETGNSANEAERLLVNQQRLAEATFQLGKAFGAMRGFTKAQLKDQIILTKLYGLEEESAAGLQQLALSNKMTADDIVSATVKQTASLAKQTGIQLDNKKVLGEVAKVSGQLRLQYQNNPALIAQAVVQTEKLGINLEKAKNMANSLLQFEDSISAELEAELLTGKQINLEEARLLALNGKTAEAASKVAEQIGTSAEFSSMNVLQQEAYAKALGMSADELANMLLYNENINNLGANTKKQIEEEIALAKQRGDMEKVRYLENSIGNEEAAKKALEEIDAQTKFNEILEKGKAILASFIEGPASKFVEMLSDVGNLTDRIVGTIKAIGIAFTAIKLSGFLGQLASMTSILSAGAVSALTIASGITLGIGLLAVGAAVASALGVFDSQKEEASQIPAYKDGGLVANSGIALVGEEGPELVTLPAGANVTTAGKTKDILNSKGESQTIVKGGETSLTIDGTTFARLVTPFIVTELDKRYMQLQ